MNIFKEFPKPYFSVSESLENAVDKSGLPKIKMINYDSEVRRMIPKFSYCLNRLKKEGFANKINSKRKNVSILKEIIRYKSKYGKPYEWQNYSIDLDTNNDYASGFSNEKSTISKTRNRSEDLSRENRSSNDADFEPIIKKIGDKSSLRKAMNYFVNQRLKGNSPIDYTSFFIMNNDKYINKFSSL